MVNIELQWPPIVDIALRANSTPRALKRRSDYYHFRFTVLPNNCNHMKGAYSSPIFAKKMKIFFLVADFPKNCVSEAKKEATDLQHLLLGNLNLHSNFSLI